MRELVDDLLALAQPGGDATDRVLVDLPTVATGYWGTVDTAQATLEVDTDRAVRADESLLRQLLENLFRNAVEHCSPSPDSQTRQDAVEHGGDDVP